MYAFPGVFQNQFVPQQFWPVFMLLALWEIYWKGRGLWKAAQNKELGWFIAILIINTIGILPIVYLYFFQKKPTKKKSR